MSDKICVMYRSDLDEWLSAGWKCIGLSENGQFMLVAPNGS